MGSDELAYMSAAEIAERVRRRSLSPVEIVESCIARIERRNPSLNAFVFKGFDDARREARAAEAAVMSGAATGPLHGVPTAIKDLFDFKPGWPFTFGGVRAMRDCVAQLALRLRGAHRESRRDHPWQDQQPNHGPARNLRQLLVRPFSQPIRHTKKHGRLFGRQRGRRRGRTRSICGGNRRWRFDPNSRRLVQRCRFQGVVRPRSRRYAAQCLRRDYALCFRRPDQLERREDAALVLSALAGYDPRDPFSIETHEDFLAATRRSIKGWKIAYSPDFDVFPIDAAVGRTVDEAVRRFADAGAVVEEVRLGLKRSQRELSETWTRLMTPLNISRFGGHESVRHRPYGAAPRGFSSRLPAKDRRLQELSAMDLTADQAIRSEVYDAIQGVLTDHEILVSPTVARCRSKMPPTATPKARLGQRGGGGSA